MKIQGKDAYNSPEFKAFCKRFNIPWGLLTTNMIIEMPVQGMMTVTQTYTIEEEKDKIDTTNLHNEKYTTFEPNRNK